MFSVVANGHEYTVFVVDVSIGAPVVASAVRRIAYVRATGNPEYDRLLAEEAIAKIEQSDPTPGGKPCPAQ